MFRSKPARDETGAAAMEKSNPSELIVERARATNGAKR